MQIPWLPKRFFWFSGPGWHPVCPWLTNPLPWWFWWRDLPSTLQPMAKVRKRSPGRKSMESEFLGSQPENVWPLAPPLHTVQEAWGKAGQGQCFAPGDCQGTEKSILCLFFHHPQHEAFTLWSQDGCCTSHHLACIPSRKKRHCLLICSGLPSYGNSACCFERVTFITWAALIAEDVGRSSIFMCGYSQPKRIWVF